MPLELNTLIVTKNKEKRIKDNEFLLIKEGYRLYPLDVPVEIRKTVQGSTSGYGVIEKLEWEKEKTTIYFKLISLNSVN